jgi:glucosamine kinase
VDAVIGGRRVAVGGYGGEVSDEAGGQRMGREVLRRALWTFDGRTETTALSTAILERFEWDPAKIVCFAARATPADYAEFAPLVLEYALAKGSLAVAIVQEAAEAATRIIERLGDVGCPAISLIGGLAEPLMEWLPTDVRRLLSAAQCDPLDGAILIARRAFFRLESLTLRAGQNAQISHIVARRADEIRAISTPHRQQTHNGVSENVRS